MWKIKQIFDGDYGCEETCSETGQAKEPMVSVTLVEEDTGEKGKEPVSLTPGSIIDIPTGIKHWHGAKENCWFSHLAVEIPGKDSGTEWLEKVSDQEYSKL